VSELELPDPSGASAASESDIETAEVRKLVADPAAGAPWLAGDLGERLVRELVRELGLPKSEGESKQDYANGRRSAGRLLLGLRDDSSS
jgi:hypothetical protein